MYLLVFDIEIEKNCFNQKQIFNENITQNDPLNKLINYSVKQFSILNY